MNVVLLCCLICLPGERKTNVEITTNISAWTCKSCLYHINIKIPGPISVFGFGMLLYISIRNEFVKDRSFLSGCNGTMNKWSMMLFTVICSFTRCSRAASVASPRLVSKIIGHEFVSLGQIIIKIKAREK